MPALPRITAPGHCARQPTIRRAVHTASLITAASMVCVAAAGAANPGNSTDPYLPDHGNTGYDVDHYAIAVEYHPADVTITGTTTLTARATEPLTVFHLDLLQNTSQVHVNGQPAAFSREGAHELVVTPATPIAKNTQFDVTVTYSGSLNPEDIDHPSAYYKQIGPTDDGGVLVLGQPYAAGYWYPSNDHPSDKATYDISITAPKHFDGISNGVKQEETINGYKKTTRWRENNPMTTYLSFLSVGKYTYYTNWNPTGPPSWVAVAAQGIDKEVHQNAVNSVRLTPAITQWSEGLFGPYPFETKSAIVPAKDFYFALENQGRPVYSPALWQNGSSYSIVVHEIAHQWFGNSVSLNSWQDIWLNEGFATWAEWKYDEDYHNYTANDTFKNTYQLFGPKNPAQPSPQDDAFWGITLTDPGARRIFSNTVYVRGAMTVQALRNRLGDEAFSRLLQEWTTRYAHSNATTTDFIALAEEISGQDLTSFFNAWLNSTTRPAPTPANGIPDPSWGEPKTTPFSARDQELLDRMYRTHARPSIPH